MQLLTSNRPPSPIGGGCTKDGFTSNRRGAGNRLKNRRRSLTAKTTMKKAKPNRFTELPKKSQKIEPQLPKPIQKPYYRNRIYRNRKIAVRGIGKLEEGNQNISIFSFALARKPQPRTQHRTPALCLSLTLSGDNTGSTTAAATPTGHLLVAPISPPLTSPPPTSAQVLLDAQDWIRRSPIDLELGCTMKNRDINEFNEKMESLNIVATNWIKKCPIRICGKKTETVPFKTETAKITAKKPQYARCRVHIWGTTDCGVQGADSLQALRGRTANIEFWSWNVVKKHYDESTQ
ncbi:hypothetical protein LXL04_026697 [Taraxacum kok-saghyz]